MSLTNLPSAIRRTSSAVAGASAASGPSVVVSVEEVKGENKK